MPAYLRLPLAKLSPLFALAVCYGSSSAVRAQSAAIPAIEPQAQLKEVVVSGTRNERAVEEVPASVDVLNASEIESGQVKDIRDAVREMPNVSVRRSAPRFTLAGSSNGRDGNAGFNVRGLEGNRVLLLVDGIRAPRGYSFGANAFSRDYFDFGLFKRIEVVKGASSALYGSDGLAGLVSFITREPEDFLSAGKAFGGQVGLRYSGDDGGLNLGGTVAGKASETVSWLINGNVNRAHELDNQGTNNSANVDRTTPNPQRDRGYGLTGKLVWRPSALQKHTFTLESVDKRSEFELLSARAKPPLTANSTLASDAFTTVARDRLTWVGEFKTDTLLADRIKTWLSWQDSRSREYASEDRNTAADRVRDTLYKERSQQFGVQADKTLAINAAWGQRLTYGADYVIADLFNSQTGVTPAAGETFPLKRFPNTKETSAAVYLQDEFFSEQWSITPALRFDTFKVNPSQEGFAPAVSSLSGSAVSPKLSALYKVTPQWGVYGNIAQGFKAPNAYQLNEFFENFTQFYRTIPNPNLKPEKSQTLEIGVKGRSDRLAFDAAVFTGRYKDFIEDRSQVSGAGVLGNPTIFQSVNLNNVRLSGFEFKGEYDWGKWGDISIKSPFAFGQVSGKDTRTQVPINSIDPRRLFAGLRFSTAGWDARLSVTHRAAKKLSDTNGGIQAAAGAPPVAQFVTPASTTLDLSGQWRIRKDLRLTAAVYNLTNRKYWNWADSRGLPSNSTTLDVYSQPGRFLTVSLVADF